MKIALLAIDAIAEALLLRGILETLGATVHLRPAGKPSDVFAPLDVFDGLADVLILCAHGDENGLIFPAMAPGVDRLVLPGDRITPDELDRLPRGLAQVVVSTACASGKESFARAVFNAGAKTYVAPSGDPDGAAAALIVGIALHRVIRNGASWTTAVATANAAFAPEDGFTVFGA